MPATKLNNHIEKRVDREREKFRLVERKTVTTKYNINNIGGDVVKDNETYVLTDNKTLKNLVLSQTQLHAGQQTRGHRHPGQEEVYIFVSGSGLMIVGDETDAAFEVSAGDIVLIPDGAFHRVINNTESDFVFNCVFDGKRNH